MRILGLIVAFALLTAAVPAGAQTCYECLAKACFDAFSIRTGGIDQQLEEDLAGVEQQLAEMQMAAAQKAEVQQATEAVLRGNAERRKRGAFDALARCIAEQ